MSSVSRRARLLPVVLITAVALVAGLHPPAYAALPSKATWLHDVSTALAGDGTAAKPNATTWLRRKVNNRQPGEKLAMNLDIDNTSLATHYDWPNAVPQTLKLAQTYQPEGVYLLFNTGRYEDELTDVKQKLRAAGFRWYRVCGRRHGESLTTSKGRCRRSFVADGFTLVVNIGNSPTDFTNTANFQQKYVLPNYGGQLS